VNALALASSPVCISVPQIKCKKGVQKHHDRYEANGRHVREIMCTSILYICASFFNLSEMGKVSVEGCVVTSFTSACDDDRSALDPRMAKLCLSPSITPNPIGGLEHQFLEGSCEMIPF
jgi:hypothetical protein